MISHPMDNLHVTYAEVLSGTQLNKFDAFLADLERQKGTSSQRALGDEGRDDIFRLEGKNLSTARRLLVGTSTGLLEGLRPFLEKYRDHYPKQKVQIALLLREASNLKSDSTSLRQLKTIRQALDVVLPLVEKQIGDLPASVIAQLAPPPKQ